jgi:hypothetical protein
LPAGWHSQQFAHHYAQLYELPAGWHLPHVAFQIKHRASPEQDDFNKCVGLPKGLLAGWHPQQFAHHYAQLYELPAGWHLPHVASQIEQHASPEQDDFDGGAGPPKGPPLPLRSLV